MEQNATFEDARDIAIVLGEYLFSFLHPLCRSSWIFDFVSLNTSWHIIVAIIVSSFLFHWHHM